MISETNEDSLTLNRWKSNRCSALPVDNWNIFPFVLLDRSCPLWLGEVVLILNRAGPAPRYPIKWGVILCTWVTCLNRLIHNPHPWIKPRNWVMRIDHSGSYESRNPDWTTITILKTVAWRLGPRSTCQIRRNWWHKFVAISLFPLSLS